MATDLLVEREREYKPEECVTHICSGEHKLNQGMYEEWEENDVADVLSDEAMQPDQHHAEGIEPDAEEKDAALKQPLQEKIVRVGLIVFFLQRGFIVEYAIADYGTVEEHVPRILIDMVASRGLCHVDFQVFDIDISQHTALVLLILGHDVARNFLGVIGKKRCEHEDNHNPGHKAFPFHFPVHERDGEDSHCNDNESATAAREEYHHDERRQQTEV